MAAKTPSEPLTEAVKFINIKNCYSRDIAMLQYKYSYVPVFLWGKHKLDFSDYPSLNQAPRFGMGMTQGDNYCMYLYHGEPVVITCFQNPGLRAKIHGEVFLLPPSVLFKLDEEMQNGVFFTRCRRPIMWHTPGSNTSWYSNLSECWMYVGDFTKWTAKIKEGSLKPKSPVISQTGANNQRKWYMFTAHDDMHAAIEQPHT